MRRAEVIFKNRLHFGILSALASVNNVEDAPRSRKGVCQDVELVLNGEADWALQPQHGVRGQLDDCIDCGIEDLNEHRPRPVVGG